mgnify:FL=1
MMRSALLGGFALCLAACDNSPFDPERAEEAARAGGDVQMQPGLYRSRVSIGAAGGDAAGSQYGDDTICFTQEDVAGGNREMLLAMQGRDSCRFDSYDLSGDRLEAVMVCKGGQFQPETEARISGTVTPTASDLQMTVAGFENVAGKPAGGIEMRVTNERIADCPESGN